MTGGLRRQSGLAYSNLRPTSAPETQIWCFIFHSWLSVPSLAWDDLFEQPANCSQDPSGDQSRLRPRTGKPNYMNWRLQPSTTEADNDTNSISEAVNRPDKAQWTKAMQEELQSLEDNEVWTLVDRSKGVNVVTNRWVLRIKHKLDETIDCYRTRLVARGFSQREGVDYNGIYAPVADSSTMRMRWAHAAVSNLHITQFDSRTASLYGNLEGRSLHRAAWGIRSQWQRSLATQEEPSWPEIGTKNVE